MEMGSAKIFANVPQTNERLLLGSHGEMNCKHFVSVIVFFILSLIYIKSNEIMVMP